MYIDPSGHDPWWLDDADSIAEYYEDGGGGSNNWKLNLLIDYVESDIVNKKTDKKGNVPYVTKKKNGTVMDSFIMTVEKAASIYGNNWNGFFDATDYVFSGWFGHGAGTMWNAHQSDFPGYFDGDTGFHPDYIDGSNQVRHFWVALASAADPYGDNPSGEGVALVGNYSHEYVEDWVLFWKKGSTIVDYQLSVTGIDIASQIGPEKDIETPSALAPVLKERSGFEGQGYIGPPVWVGPWLSPDW